MDRRTGTLALAMALLFVSMPASAGLVKVDAAPASDGSEVAPPSGDASVQTTDRHEAIEQVTGPVSPSGRHAVPWGTEPPGDDIPIDPELSSGGTGGGGDPVPEPTTIALLGLGLMSMAGGTIARRRRAHRG